MSIGISNPPVSLEDWWIRRSSRSKQCSVVLKEAVIYILYFVWEARNWYRFKRIAPSLRVSIQKITSHLYLTGLNTYAASSSSLVCFRILKLFNIKILPPDAPRIIELFWQPPLIAWLKCNCDGAFTPNSVSMGCGV